jgi:uncharacterized protein YdeI (YjbR/CyaY-like superfamily)
MDKWQQEFAALRAIAVDCQLTEELKWGRTACQADPFYCGH